MKIINNKKNQKRILVAALAVALILIGLICYAFLFHGSIFGWTISPKQSDANSIDYQKPTSDQEKNGQVIKNNSINNDSTKNGTSGSDVTPAPVAQPNGKSIVQMTITAANQNSTALQIRSLIGAIESTGTCTLTLTGPLSKSVVMTSSVQASSNTSTCQGFDVPLSDLSSGNWKITITFNNDATTGTASKGITIE